MAWLALLLVGAMFLVAFLALRRPPKSVATRARTATESAASSAGSSYYNRAIWREAGAGAGQPEAADARRSAIGGNVFDMDGRPLEGAVVTAMTFELAGNIPSLAGSVKSDQGGHFELPLPEGTYQINAGREGYGPASATVRTGDTVSLVLPQSGLVTGRVLDEKKQPVTQFTIDVISVVPSTMPAPAPVWSKAFSSPDGSFRVDQLPGWSVIIKASAPGFASAFSQPMTVEAKKTMKVELMLPVGCALVGRVEDGKGTPVPYVLLDAESRLIAGSSSENSLQTGNQVQSDTDGKFRIEHVPTGMVHVRAYDGGHAVTTVTVDVQSCEKAPAVKVVVSQGGGVAGLARTSDGKPLAGARLSLSNRVIGFVAGRSDAEGRFRFERIPPGMARMELHNEGQRTLVNVEIKDGQVTKQDLVMFARGKGELRGRITAGGRPLPGVRLLIASGHGEQGVDTYYSVTQQDGTYRVASLPEGLYLISVISTTKGQGTKVPAGGVITVDLDVTPKPEPPEQAEEPDDEPIASPAPGAPGAPPSNAEPAGGQSTPPTSVPALPAPPPKPAQ